MEAKSPPGVMTLHLAQTTGTGGIMLLHGESKNLTLSVQGTGTTSGGVITLEDAYYDVNGPVYAGTWDAITTVNASDVTGGKQKTVCVQGNFWAIRARISSDITGGGSVTVVAWAN